MRMQLLVAAAAICLVWAGGTNARAQSAKSGGGGFGGSSGLGKKKGSSGEQTLDIETVNVLADNEFKRFDKDGDGKLNQEEMPFSLKRDLDKWDKSGDGLIDRDEYRAYYLAKLNGNAQGTRPQPGTAAPPRAKWEYRVESSRDDLQADLNKVAADGWELTAIVPASERMHATLIFRRPVAEQPNPAPKKKAEATLELRIYPLKHASATDLVILVENALEPNHFTMRVVAEQRTNQLIVNGPADAHAAVQTILNQLDVPTTEPRTGTNRPGGPGSRKKE